MAQVWFWLLGLFCSSAIAAVSLKNPNGNEKHTLTEECKQRCEGSYPQHTYPKKEPLEACLRGCRLSLIRQFSLQEREKKNVTESCVQGCQEGYVEKDSQYACNVGCKGQKFLPSPKSLIEEENGLQENWEAGPYLVFYPVLYFRQYCHGFLTRATYYIQSSSVYYFMAQDGHTVMVRVQERPHVFIRERQNLRDRMVEEDEPERVQIQAQDDSNGVSWKIIRHGHNWLKCVSKRSGMPLWLVLATLLLSSMFLLWLCCASADTAPKHLEKQLLVDNLFFLEDQTKLQKKPLLRCEETETAGPLPLKVNIDATII